MSDKFVSRHIGPREADVKEMLDIIGVGSLNELIDKTIPKSIRFNELKNTEAISEYEYIKSLKEVADKNKLYRNYIGLGYYETILPPAIQRNILENPSWYTSYTPYQAEISQGRLEALLNFQTMVMELTSLEIANASLLDEATAAAEAMIMLYNSRSREKAKQNANVFLVDNNIFPQTLDVLKTRSESLGIVVKVEDYTNFTFTEDAFGAIVQYPAADGEIRDYKAVAEKAHENDCTLVVASDILALTLLTPPGEWGADVVVGSTQRFGIPMGYGGPHAGYFATKEKYKRNVPGRIIGVSVDRHGNKALRMALQTREQHIKRERATSNICTAQALLASMAGMYAAYHGKEGLKRIALKIHTLTAILAKQLIDLGYKITSKNYFDTIIVELPEEIKTYEVRDIALEHETNFWYFGSSKIGINLGETATIEDVNHIAEIFATVVLKPFSRNLEFKETDTQFDSKFLRKSDFLTQQVFNKYRSETELMRYVKKLEKKDFSLTHSMISLGSCTMKLNAAAEMMALTWPEFSNLHPFVPIDQTEGYQQLVYELGETLKQITGFPGISFQPNSGAAGEYTGLIVIREYHKKNKQEHRNIVLIPSSAHGTNPASAVMAGSKVVIVKCDDEGNIDLEDLKNKAEEHKENLSAIMITYPSTHGVFEENILDIIKIIHDCGGLVYMDGANMNAQVGLTNPAQIGADVCHLNLHKTFAIPHGGGGPGMGPICVAEHLIEFLPTHPVIETGGINGVSSVSAAPWGSASILTISHAYCKLLGSKGLTEATKFAILNANYIASSLKDDYKILYKGRNGFVGHEMILDCRPFKQNAGISDADIAKRLMDFGFHAPTLSFPVHGTLMVEPTESESKEELDRFIFALKAIKQEIAEVENGNSDKTNNILKNSPHTASVVASDEWEYPYSRQQAAFPADWVRDNKFWPAVGRVDDAFGDRNLQCSCAPLEEYMETN